MVLLPSNTQRLSEILMQPDYSRVSQADKDEGITFPLGNISREEFCQVRDELEYWGFNGLPNPDTGELVKLSSDERSRDFQVRCEIMRRRKRAENEQRQASGRLPTEVEKLIEHEQAALKALVPGTIYEQALFSHPNTLETPVIAYFRRTWPIVKPHSVMFGGATGCGKTFGVIAFVASRMEKRNIQGSDVWNAEFVTARQVSEAQGSGKDEKERMHRLRTVRMLIIDDLKIAGEGGVTPAFVSAVEDLFAYRHQKYNLETYFTTNGNLDEVRQTYGDRIYSRFQQGGNFQFGGFNDLRAKGV